MQNKDIKLHISLYLSISIVMNMEIRHEGIYRVCRPMIYTQDLVNECSVFWSVIIFSLHQMLLGWQSRKNKLGKACRMDGKIWEARREVWSKL
jgi:hypothetical protein